MSRTGDMKKIMEMINLDEVVSNPFFAFASWGIINEDIPYSQLSSLHKDIPDNPALAKKWAYRLGLRPTATPEQVLRVIKAKMDQKIFPELSPKPENEDLKSLSSAKEAIRQEMKNGISTNSHKFSVRLNWAIELGLEPNAPYDQVLSGLQKKIDEFLFPKLTGGSHVIPLHPSMRMATVIKKS